MSKNNKLIVLGSVFVAAILFAGACCGAKVFKNEDAFALNLSTEELTKRTDSNYLINVNLLDVNSPEYLALQDGDKQALKHLVKAADILENIQLQLDNRDNIAFREYLVNEVKKGNKELLDQINKSIKKMKEDGKINELAAKYADATNS